MTGLLEYIELAKQGVDLANNSSNYKNKFLRTIRRNRKILILGPSGGGKSQFINSITEKNFSIPERTPEAENHKIPFLDYTLELIDTPGQGTKDFIRKREIKKLHKGKGLEGIINICSYGYLEAPEAGRKIAIPHNTVTHQYISNNLKAELNHVDEWLSDIEPNRNIKWIINLVTKADLWWEKYDTVMEYYKSGEYGQKLSPLKSHVNIQTIPYCSIIKPFFEVNRDSTFGEIEKMALKNQYIQLVRNLVNNS